MKQNIEIEVPEGYKAVYNETTKKVEIVKIDNKPKTWEEFCEKYPIRSCEGYITIDSNVKSVGSAFTSNMERSAKMDKNFFTSVEEAEGFLALMQLRQLRKAWVGDWKPSMTEKRYIIKYDSLVGLCVREDVMSSLMDFPTNEMALEFVECFTDLLKKAKILL